MQGVPTMSRILKLFVIYVYHLPTFQGFTAEFLSASIQKRFRTFLSLTAREITKIFIAVRYVKNEHRFEQFSVQRQPQWR